MRKTSASRHCCLAPREPAHSTEPLSSSGPGLESSLEESSTEGLTNTAFWMLSDIMALQQHRLSNLVFMLESCFCHGREAFWKCIETTKTQIDIFSLAVSSTINISLFDLIASSIRVPISNLVIPSHWDACLMAVTLDSMWHSHISNNKTPVLSFSWPLVFHWRD